MKWKIKANFRKAAASSDNLFIAKKNRKKIGVIYFNYLSSETVKGCQKRDTFYGYTALAINENN